MKKIINKLNFALIGILCTAPAMADVNESGLCILLKDLHSVFNMLRTLAFVGAAFTIAGWAWGYISSGKAEIKDLKDKGTGLLVGFILLFAIGMVLSFLMTTSGAKSIGCQNELLNW